MGLRGVVGVHAAAVGACGPAGFGDHHGLAGVTVPHAVYVVARVGQCVLDRLVLPQRVGVHGNEVEIFDEWGQLVEPGHIVLAERHRLRDARLDVAHQLDHARHGHEVVGPVHGGFVADGRRKDDVVVPVGQPHEAVDFGIVLGPVGGELGRAVVSAPRAARVAGLGAEVRAEQHLERQAMVADHLQHTLGVQAAVVQAQQPPVRLQDAQVFEDLGFGRVGLVARTLAAAVARVADRAAGRQGQRAGRLVHGAATNLGWPRWSHKPQNAPTSPSAPTFQASSKAANQNTSTASAAAQAKVSTK
jgi:hypothetical protein